MVQDSPGWGSVTARLGRNRESDLLLYVDSSHEVLKASKLRFLCAIAPCLLYLVTHGPEQSRRLRQPLSMQRVQIVLDCLRWIP